MKTLTVTLDPSLSAKDPRPCLPDLSQRRAQPLSCGLVFQASSPQTNAVRGRDRKGWEAVMKDVPEEGADGRDRDDG